MQRTQLKLKSLATIVMLVIISACSAPAASQPVKPAPVKSASISVSGAFALYPLVVQWAGEYQKAHPEISIDVSAGGAGKGMADVLSKAADIGMLSRPITPEEEGKGALAFPVARDAVFCILNAQNPYKDQLLQHGIAKEILKKIFMGGNPVTWGEVLGKPEITDEVHVYTRSDSAGAAEMWAKYLGGSKQEDLQGIGVNGDPGILDAVVKDTLGIGYNNLNYAYDNKTGQAVNGVLILPLDINQNGKIDPEENLATKQQAVDAVAKGLYPSPPARNLFLVTNGKPSESVNAFLSWILTTGQKDLDQAGYIVLAPADLKTAQDMLH
jgi:phosphate transport system substrate-binding protein